MPHGSDVEAAAKFDIFGQVGQVDVQHDQVRDALVAFRLEMVLGHPHGVEAIIIQGLRDGFGLAENGHQVIVVEFPVVHRLAAVADIGHIYVAGIHTVKFSDHISNPFPILI